MPKTTDKLNIAIIGIGLIGGSLLRALNDKGYNITAVTSNKKTAECMNLFNRVQNVTSDLEDLKDADVIFIAGPMNKVCSTLHSLQNIVKKSCIVTDVASLKSYIFDYINANKLDINFIGGHPMAGTEKTGFDNSFSEMFKEAKWVLTPTEKTSKEDLDLLSSIIDKTGAEIVITNPRDHDKAVGLVSHLPALVSQALFQYVNNYHDENVKDLALTLASSGFRDTTRISMSSHELVSGMVTYNKNNLKISIPEYENMLNKLFMRYKTEDETLLNELNQVISERNELYSKEGKNIYKK